MNAEKLIMLNEQVKRALVLMNEMESLIDNLVAENQKLLAEVKRLRGE